MSGISEKPMELEKGLKVLGFWTKCYVDCIRVVLRRIQVFFQASSPDKVQVSSTYTPKLWKLITALFKLGEQLPYI